MTFALKSTAAILVAAIPVLTTLACVTQELREVSAAREAHRRCVEEHSVSHPDCVTLKERLDTSERRYEENARRAWSCDPVQESCPTPR